jgi:hypothetical protein
LMSGIFHAYYTVALAPAVGALVGIGATLLWRERTVPAAPVAVDGAAPAGAGTRAGRRALAATLTLAVTLGVSAWWSWRLLGRSADWHPWLRTAVLVTGLAAAVLIVLVGWLPRRITPVVLALGAAAALAGPVAYSLQTAGAPHTGAIPSAGPFIQDASGPGRGGFPGGGQPPGGRQFPGGGQFPAFPGGQLPNGGQLSNGGQLPNGGQVPRGGQVPGMPSNGQGRSSRGGGMGGLLDAREPSAELRALLAKNSADYTWIAAAVGSNNASGYQLATGDPVMAIGGFNGSDPSPTLDQFKRYVADGKIHYFVGGGGFRANGGSSASQEIASWVADSFTSQTVDGVAVYDLSSGQEG